MLLSNSEGVSLKMEHKKEHWVLINTLFIKSFSLLVSFSQSVAFKKVENAHHGMPAFNGTEYSTYNICNNLLNNGWHFIILSFFDFFHRWLLWKRLRSSMPAVTRTAMAPGRKSPGTAVVFSAVFRKLKRLSATAFLQLSAWTFFKDSTVLANQKPCLLFDSVNNK